MMHISRWGFQYQLTQGEILTNYHCDFVLETPELNQPRREE